MTGPTVSLAGRTVLVTGGSRGIGYAIAAACLRAGARVTIAAKTPATLDAAVDKLRAEAPDAVDSVRCDVSDPASVDAAVAHAESTFGRIHGLVHAAGILGPIGTVLHADPEEWLAAVRVNLFGTFLPVRAVGRHMARHGGGRIVCLSGGGASGPFPNFTSYASAKVAVVRFCETVAVELASAGVEVNALAPGFVATDIHLQTLRAGDRAGAGYLASTKAQLDTGGVPPEVAAEAATFLLSDAAWGITGRFVAGAYDRFGDWPAHLAELDGTDLFTLRRILPGDRGGDWQ